jgi:arylsulfatase A
MTLTRRALLSGAPALLRAQSSKPNILLILMDDMSCSALSCYGGKHVETPNLDALAADGVRFTDAYVASQCTPTRATILTGQYTARNKMWHVIPWYGLPYARVREEEFRENLPREAFTLAKGLKAVGYATGCFGKWHLTANGDGNYKGLNAAASRYYGFDAVASPARAREFQSGDKGVDRLTGETIAFMRANRDRPFLAYLPHHTTHNPLAAPEALVKKHRDRGFPETGLNNATALACIEHMDRSIGRLVSALDEMKLREKTMIVFLTDNGGIFRAWNHVPEAGRLIERERILEATPFREGKGSAYEGGVRVPMIVNWPGAVRGGQVCRTPVHAVDLMPTFFSLAGARLPEGYVADGADLRPLLDGRGIAPRRLYSYMPFYDLRWALVPSASVRDGDWKLIESFGDHFDLGPSEARYVPERRLELYNLREDPGEKRDLAAAQPSRVETMRRDLHRWIESCGARVPQLNPRHDPARQFAETRERPSA